MINLKPEESVSKEDNFMKIDASNTKITTLLKNSYYCIPRFQRKYVWSTKEVNDFLNDINENPINYFIGSVVLYIYQQEDNERKDVKGIVDGQQRLTTILLILMAISKSFYEIAQDISDETIKNKIISSSNGTYNNYIVRKDDDENTRHVITSETSKLFLEKLFDKTFSPETLSNQELEKLTEEENTILNAYSVIIKFLLQITNGKSKEEQYEILYNFREKVFQLSIIAVELIDLESAHIVFDSLNDRGKSIDTVDKTKSYILRLLKKGTLDTDSPLTRWNKIQEKLNSNYESSIFSDYLEAYVKSIIPREISKENLFSVIKEELICKDANKANEFLKNLEENIKYYLAVYNQSTLNEIHEISNDYVKSIIKSLATLKVFNIKAHTSFVMHLLREFSKGHLSMKNISKFIEAAVKFHFRYNVIYAYPGNTIRSHYRESLKSMLGVQTDKNSILRNLNFDDIKYNVQNFEEFEEKFRQKVRYSEREKSNRKLVRYILETIDKYCLHSSIALDYSLLTIEHLIPQSNENYDVEQIGNLIFTTKSMQDKLKDKTLKEKLLILDAEGFFNNYKNRLLIPEISEIGNNIEDNIKLIEQRSSKLIKISFDNIW